MKEAKVDVPVAMIFFNRPDTLKDVFASVKKARPTKLFLIQDGAREGNEKDAVNVQECRRVVEDIDWECDVKKIYSEENLGCGRRIYSGLSEAFESVDRLIILEDDVVADESFFGFCKEMLEKYKDDERIFEITGMNHCGVNTRCPYSYFFSEIGSCWGWATWKRSWDKMRFDFDFLKDEYAIRCYLNLKLRSKPMRKEIIMDCEKRYNILKVGGKLSAWTTQFMMAESLNSGLIIVPKYNLTKNIGLTQESTHASNSIKKIPRGLQCIFFAKTYTLESPLKYPKYVVADNEYAEQVLKIMGWTPVRKVTRRIESVVRRLIFAEKGEIKKMLKKLLKVVK